MLDSYKEIPENETHKFSAYDHLNKLCKTNNLAVNEYARVTYQMGWSDLLGQLVLELKNYPVKLVEVEDSHGQLDIKFGMLKKRNEVLVWRSLQHFKDLSRVICMQCGTKSTDIKNNGLNLRFCAECFKSVPKLNKTGTWLDKY